MTTRWQSAWACFWPLASSRSSPVSLSLPRRRPSCSGPRSARRFGRCRAKDKPTLIIHLPEKPSGAGIVICPGGGYGGLAMDHEGNQIAKWLNDHGIAGFILNYRHRGKGYGHPAPLNDAQRAIRTVRARAKEFGVEPTKIGILGFSAGGHLTSSAVTHFDAGNAKSDDPVEQASCRPDFGVLCYPVIAFDQPYTHRGSQKNLLGRKRRRRTGKQHVEREASDRPDAALLPLAHHRR